MANFTSNYMNYIIFINDREGMKRISLVQKRQTSESLTKIVTKRIPFLLSPSSPIFCIAEVNSKSMKIGDGGDDDERRIMEGLLSKESKEMKQEQMTCGLNFLSASLSIFLSLYGQVCVTWYPKSKRGEVSWILPNTR